MARICALVSTLCVLAMLSGCAGRSSRATPPAPAFSDRTLARGALETFETVCVQLGRACVQAEDDNDTRCESAFQGIYDQIRKAKSATIAWTAFDQGRIACMLRDLELSMQDGESLANSLGVSAHYGMAPAMELSHPVSVSCTAPTPPTQQVPSVEQSQHAADGVIHIVTGD